MEMRREWVGAVLQDLQEFAGSQGLKVLEDDLRHLIKQHRNAFHDVSVVDPLEQVNAYKLPFSDTDSANCTEILQINSYERKTPVAANSPNKPNFECNTRPF